MKVACPSCRHETHIENDAGDFPTRCAYCFGLMRLSADDMDLPPRARSIRLEGPSVRRSSRGELADMLLTRPGTISVAVGVASPSSAMLLDDSLPQEPSFTSPGPRMPQLRRNAPGSSGQEALGTFGWIGLGAVFVLAIIAIAMRAQSLASAHAKAPVGLTQANR